MTTVLRSLANGVAALGTPLMRWGFPEQSQTPFADDRKRLYEDYRRVHKDLEKSIEKVKQEHGAKAHRR